MSKSTALSIVFLKTPLTSTFSGMPPGNGMAFGGVLEQNNHYGLAVLRAQPALAMVSRPIQFRSQPDFHHRQASFWSQRRRTVGAADGALAAVFSTNRGWATTGKLDRQCPRATKTPTRTGHAGVQISCNKLGPYAPKQILACTRSLTSQSSDHFVLRHRS